LTCSWAKLTAKVQPRYEEAEMYSSFSYQIAQERVADLHRQAQHDALVRAARQGRQGRQAPKRQSGHRVPWFPFIAARRVRTA
jgi:hypothetical protein